MEPDASNIRLVPSVPKWVEDWYFLWGPGVVVLDALGLIWLFG
jgi:hypothetical protein